MEGTQIAAELQYQPAPSFPSDFEKRLKDITGVCPIGVPGFRFVWGCDRKKFYGGEEDQVYLDPMGKYVGLPYFVGEAWTPPDVYDRAEWEAGRYGMLIPDGDYGDCKNAQPVECQNPTHFGGWGFHQKYDATIDVLGPFPEKGVWDFVTFCYDPHTKQPFTFDRMLDVAREWKHNFDRPNSGRRAVEDHMRYMDGIKAMKKAAFEEAKGIEREEIARELARPDTNRVNSFDRTGDTPKTVNIPLPSGMKETSSGIIVPGSTIDQ